MKNINPASTGAIAISVSQLVPIVDWALHGFSGAIPASLSDVIAGLIFASSHMIYNIIANKIEEKEAKQ